MRRCGRKGEGGNARERDQRWSTLVAKRPRMKDATVTSVMDDLGMDGGEDGGGWIRE